MARISGSMFEAVVLLACGAVFGCCFAVLGCGGMLAEPPPQVETAALHDGAGDPVIATLHTKDSELRIIGAGGSVRYALIDAEGTSKSLTLEELQSYDPNLYEFVKAATAAALHGASPLDARVYPQSDKANASGRVEAGALNVPLD